MKNLIFVSVLILGLNSVANANDEEPGKYEIDRDTYKVELILDTCKDLFIQEIEDILSSKDEIVILPKTIGYQYFSVKVRTAEGRLALPKNEYQYEFQYWTEDDQHLKCTRIDPVDYVY